ncbi:MAG: hypothetical protein IKW14_03760 [Phascolarctobacterium sp.]|nr:hypothetical protein [Phascolarctobacterium sp.]
MKEKIMRCLRKAWYYINPKFLHIDAEDVWVDGEQYMFRLEDGTLLQFEDFDCERECFRFADGEEFHPVMEPTRWDADGKPVEWIAVAFIRKA